MAKNFFEAHRKNEGFESQITEEFQPTKEPAGSWKKIEEMRLRIEKGFPLFHPDDNPACNVQRNVCRRKMPPPPEDGEEERKAG